MNRRRQLQPYIGPLLDIFGIDIGPPMVAHLVAVADSLDETDDLRARRLNITACDEPSFRRN